MFSRSKTWSSARVILLGAALIPVLAFALVVGNLVWFSAQAVLRAGLGNLFSTKISTIYSGN